MSIFGGNQNNPTLVQNFIYYERKIHMQLFTIITVRQEQLQLNSTLVFFAENVLGGFDSSYDAVIGSSGVSKDGIAIHIHYIYLVFLSC